METNNDDVLMTKSEFFAKLERAMEDVREGRTYKMRDNESVDEFLDRIERE